MFTLQIGIHHKQNSGICLLYTSKIFIIEDEPAIREELVQLLQKYGYQCDSSDDFHHIVQAALSSGANLILLDINLDVYKRQVPAVPPEFTGGRKQKVNGKGGLVWTVRG